MPIKPADPEFLRLEYEHLQDTVENFDEKALTIKAWSITFSLAGVGAAFVEDAPILLLVAGVASLFFWLTETLWKQFQQAYYPRIKEIESWMKGEDVKHPFSPFIAQGWSLAWHEGRRKKVRLSRIMWWPHIFLPHTPIAVGAVLAWIINLRTPFVGC